MRRIYLDYAATTPLKKAVFDRMKEIFKVFGNPSSVHNFGQEATKILDEMRMEAGKIIKTDFRGIIFTGSATEANNLAIRGVVKRYLETTRRDNMIPPQIIISGGEHESIRKTAEDLSQEGMEVVVLPIYEDGRIRIEDLENAITDRTAIVSIIHTSNETGSVNDMRPISKIVKASREKMRRKIDQDHNYPLLHADVVQGFGTNDINFETLGADMMTLSAHKIGGPKGIGILAMSDEFTKTVKTRIIKPTITGGDQEMGFRAGTENIALIAGMIKAMQITDKDRNKNIEHLKEIKNALWRGIKEIYPRAEVNGDTSFSSPHILNVCFPDILSENIVTQLDLKGVMISHGSACKAKSVEVSKTIMAMYDKKRASESVRFSFGPETTLREVREAIRVIKTLSF